MQKRENSLKNKIMNFCWFPALCATFGLMADVGAAQMPNPRSAVSVTASPRSESNTVLRGDGTSSGIVSRAATNVPGRNASARAATDVPARTSSARTATNMGRSAAPGVKNIGRSATMSNGRDMGASSVAGAARAAAVSRATAVFNDVSKIGGGYAACRDSYATCMDQLCANANDTYRRCYCSEKFTEFRDTELALDQAKDLLMRFEDNNLNAVDKSAAEVNAMYSATVGEAAIKNDVSGAQAILNEIGDLLSGKKKAQKNTESIGLMSVDFSSDVDDIWGGGGSSIFDSDTGVNLEALEGLALYNAANKQCMQLITESCTNDAVLNMATSAYNIMIGQDCNLYEKKIDSQREAVKQTVRQAEKYLREARLEEYRAHNSADVNECVSKVKSAMLTDAACGANYNRCLDYSGLYINQTTGEAIYGPRLFELTGQIVLDGSSDVLGANPEFNSFLDDKRMFASSALDTCRDMADIVWGEFKRTALIEIAQAQDAKIEEIKMSCVSTMKECYDTQSKALKSFDDTTAKTSGSLAATASRSMCADKVTACAALYDGNGCKFDNKTGKLTGSETHCGLQALLNFVDSVDTTRIAEGCETVIETKLQELCTPKTESEYGYPWGCRSLKLRTTGNETNTLQHQLESAAELSCATVDDLDIKIDEKIDNAIAEIEESLYFTLRDECQKVHGYWLEPKAYEEQGSPTKLTTFYSNVFARSTVDGSELGYCVENSTRVACLNFNTEAEDGDNIATYDLQSDTCTFAESWYKTRCEFMGGYWENAICYVGKKE